MIAKVTESLLNRVHLHLLGDEYLARVLIHFLHQWLQESPCEVCIQLLSRAWEASRKYTALVMESIFNVLDMNHESISNQNAFIVEKAKSLAYWFLGEHCDTLLDLPAHPISHFFDPPKADGSKCLPQSSATSAILVEEPTAMNATTREHLNSILLRLHNGSLLGDWCERRASLKALVKIGLRLGEPIRITVYQLLAKMKASGVGPRPDCGTTSSKPSPMRHVIGTAPSSPYIDVVRGAVAAQQSVLQREALSFAPLLPAERGDIADILDPVIMCLDAYYATQCVAEVRAW